MADNIGSVVQIIDFSDSQQLTLQHVLLALQSVSTLIPGPLGVYAAHSAFSFTWQAIAQVMSNALNTLPNIGRFLFPVSDSDSKIIQFADLSANFAQTVLVSVQSNLNQTLVVLVSVMSNVSEWEYNDYVVFVHRYENLYLSHDFRSACLCIHTVLRILCL